VFRLRVGRVKRKSTVLVVDDYPSARDAVALALKGEFNCLCAGSAAQGLEILRTDPVDAVVLDIRMPEMDGIKALQRIREMGINTQVILLTGYGSFDSARKAVRYGAFDYLTKPFDLLKLRNVVAEAVEKKKVLEKGGKDAALEELAGSLTAKLAEASRLARTSELSSEAFKQMTSPLTAILGHTQILLRKVRERRGRLFGAKSLRYLSIIEEEANKCVEIASRLVSLSQNSPNRETATVNEVLLNVGALLRPQCSMSGIDLSIAPPQDEAVVDVSADDLHAVVVNLVLNSMESIEGPGEVKVKGFNLRGDSPSFIAASHEEEDYVQHVLESPLVAIEVSDTGRGIKPEHLDKIFQPFFTTKTDSSGTGLGLSICKEKVERGGGHIEVVESRPGATTMRILLPVSSRV